MKCKKCQADITVQEITVYGISDNDEVDVTVECAGCHHNIYCFVPLSDFIDADCNSDCEHD